MKLRLTEQLVNADDTPAMDGDKPATVGNGLKTALLMEFDGDGNKISSSEKLQRYDLWFKLKLAKEEVDVSPEEAVLLRKAILVYPVLVAGQLYSFLS